MERREKMAGSEVRANRRAKREQNDIERLEKQVRELKAINRSLMKQLKKMAKGIYKAEAEEALEKLEEYVPKKDKQVEEPVCPECTRKGLKEVIVAGRLFRRCETCGWKSGVVKRTN